MSRNDSSNETEISPENDGDATSSAVTTVVEEITATEFAEVDLLDTPDAVLSEEDIELKPTGKALKKKSEVEAHEAKKRSAEAKKKRNLNLFTIIITFVNQVITQMKKVHWINRKQTVAYTIAVLIFVIICVGFVAGCDVFFNFLMDKIFVFGHS